MVHVSYNVRSHPVRRETTHHNTAGKEFGTKKYNRHDKPYGFPILN